MVEPHFKILQDDLDNPLHLGRRACRTIQFSILHLQLYVQVRMHIGQGCGMVNVAQALNSSASCFFFSPLPARYNWSSIRFKSRTDIAFDAGLRLCIACHPVKPIRTFSQPWLGHAWTR